jgi:hypothetical protein
MSAFGADECGIESPRCPFIVDIETYNKFKDVWAAENMKMIPYLPYDGTPLISAPAPRIPLWSEPQ